MSTFPERLRQIRLSRERHARGEGTDRIGINRQNEDDQVSTREALDHTGLAEMKRIAQHLNEAGFTALTSATSHGTGATFACTLTVDDLGEVTCALGVRTQTLIVTANPPFARGASLIFNIGDRMALGDTVEQWILEQLTLNSAPDTSGN